MWRLDELRLMRERSIIVKLVWLSGVSVVGMLGRVGWVMQVEIMMSVHLGAPGSRES